LEVCPGSNIALGLYGDLGAHPIARLREAGCRVTVSTDDPPYFRTDMTGEYAGLARAFGWTATDFTALNETAIEAAFCEAEVKAALRKRLESEVP
jgi:adenosine deaminase